MQKFRHLTGETRRSAARLGNKTTTAQEAGFCMAHLRDLVNGELVLLRCNNSCSAIVAPKDDTLTVRPADALTKATHHRLQSKDGILQEK